MATWQFHIAFIPSRDEAIADPAAQMLEGTERFWNGFSASTLLRELETLTVGQRSKDCVTWGASDSDSLNLDIDGDTVLELRLRMDLRHADSPLVDGVLAAARRLDLSALTGDVVHPTRELLLKWAAHSTAMRFVRDPVGFFSEQSKKLQGN